jgi:hypothetical protein
MLLTSVACRCDLQPVAQGFKQTLPRSVALATHVSGSWGVNGCWSLSPPHETESNAALKMRSRIDNEVRPSTVKTWLTIWRHVLTQPIDHWLRVVAEHRMRTLYATNIFARINSMFYPTRPRRQMQSHPRPRSLRSLFSLSRAPPNIIRPTFTRQLLTGNSVEIVRGYRYIAAK